VEQTIVGGLKGVVPPVEVNGGSTAAMEGDDTTALTEGFRPCGTWVKHP
jgi:hypothetical protein